MTEYLFKGKTKDGEWVKGDLIRFRNLDIVVIWQSDHGHPVIPETVGLYTGLTDEKGTEIFVGDIVSGLFLHSRPVNGLVVFRDGAFGLLWKRADAEIYWAFTSICNVKYEVVGNIHDNPELWGVQE